MRPTRTLTVLAALTIGGPLSAQELSVSAVGAATSHELLGTLGGGAIGLRLGPPGGPFAFRLAYEYLAGTTHRTGVPCGGGPLPPGTCDPQPVRDAARMSSVSAGMSTTLLRRSRGALDLLGEFRVAHVKAERRGLTSGETLSPREFLPGADLTLEGEFRPRASWPLALQVGASAGGLYASRAECCDQYQPFAGGFGITRLRLGVAWQPRVR